jgi:hypothetical protein
MSTATAYVPRHSVSRRPVTPSPNATTDKRAAEAIERADRLIDRLRTIEFEPSRKGES